MKNILFVLVTTIMLGNGNKAPEIDIKYVTSKFKEYSDNIERVEYSIQRIDTFPKDFPQNRVVWNNKGVALIEKDETDRTFGFSFYGRRDDVAEEYIYDKGIGFEISSSTKTYKTYKGNYGFIGSPGGQMISQNIFHLDSVYKSITLIENKDRFILKYEFQDDTVYSVTETIKSIELTKDNFFPLKVTRTSKVLGNRSFSQTILSNVKINEHVQNSIKDYKSAFKDYEIIQPEKRQPNRLLGKRIPLISLPSLLEPSKVINLPIGRPILIEFWEPWCGPCIASFPKIESLKHKYSSQLDIVGIVSDDSTTAIRLIGKKNVTFLNLIGNKDLMEEFSITSWPTYFLIDKNAIVRKEYFGFSEQIENDIKEILE